MKSCFNVANEELRANPRYATASVIVITNLTQTSRATDGLLLDVSRTGMRIEANLAFRAGDAVRVDLPNLVVLAEVVHHVDAAQGSEVGLKLVHSLDREQLARFMQPLWTELLS
jgi:hypothetical protein